MNAKQLLAAMNHIDDRHIRSAGDRLFREVPHRRSLRLRPLIAAAAAAALLAASFLTAMAASEEFRDLVFDFFRISQTETVPEGSEPIEGIITPEPEKILIGDRIEGSYVHAPATGLARNGAFYICTDEVVMNSGNHHDIYIEVNGEYIRQETKTFCETYTILGNEFHVEFQWAEVNGQCCYAYIDSDALWRKPNLSGPVEATLFWFPLSLTVEDGSTYNTNYPVLINLLTGELTDILAGTGAEAVPDLYQAAISDDLTKLLLVSWDRALYYVDLPSKTLYSIDALSGEHAQSCCLTDSTLTCWALEGDSIEDGTLGSYKIWAIDLATLERRDLFSGIPATPATSYDVWSNSPLFMGGENPAAVAGLHFISGFDLSSQWGNMYSGSKFAIEVDGNRNVYVIDLATGGRSIIEGFAWPEADYPEIECIPSPDGSKLLIVCRTQPTWYDYIGVLDFSRKTYTEFSRENLNPVNEHTVYWYDSSSIVIATSDIGSMQDYYIYRLLN